MEYSKLVLAIILVAVEYAAITSTQLNINGTGNATANQSNFKVEFIGTPTTGGKVTSQDDLYKNFRSWGNYPDSVWSIINENLKYATDCSGWTTATEKSKTKRLLAKSTCQ